MYKTKVGIDNGVTGSIGILTEHETFLMSTPVKLEQSYTKKKQNISRINFKELKEIFENLDTPVVAIERPMINPQRFKASISASRCLEATLNVLELLEIPHNYIDSKAWQKDLLPKGVKGNAELKKASKDIGIRMFPQHKETIEKQKDADGILIAEYLRKQYV